MDVVAGLVMLALAAIGLVKLVGWIASLRPRHTRMRKVSDSSGDPVVDEARAAALALGYSDLNVEWLEGNAAFQTHVARLSEPSVPIEAVLGLTRSEIPTVAALGLSALARRHDVPADWTTTAISSLSSCDAALEPFVYRALDAKASYPVIGPALTKLDEGIGWEALARFVERRRRGEVLDAETFRRNVPLRLIPTLESFIDRFESHLGPDFRTHFEEWRSGTVDVEFLGSFGRVLQRPYDDPPAFLNERRGELVELIVDALEAKPRRSVLLVGEHGVGKSALVGAALERLPVHLVVFEAGAAQVNAGAMYVGELEGRVKDLADRLRGHEVAWLLPAFEETLFAGQHMRSPKGMLDALLPYVEQGELVVIGEITPTALEALLAERPRVAAAFEIVQVRPIDERGAVAAAEDALARMGITASDDALVEAYDLAQQFLPGVAAPGNLLKLVAATAGLLDEQGRKELETTDVLAALAASSGLPLALLDPNSALDLGAVATFFEQRVLGQPEAIECIVERIALTKAGLTDPTRPLGVLLFVGPTGTGKTEIAKALAEFMFGTERRLIRVDMSEFQTPDALDRLLQDTSVDQRGSVLLSAVRKEPFAVVLLDEFEKAAPPIWDLFLQVFDDGRLTDQQGRTVDFRRCIIILTSNLGSAVAHRPGVGFEAAHGRFRSELIERELKRSFRPEFLNRIDRVVVFRPFERAQMRALLDKELAAALARRGLRGRPWAVELDDSAYEFLIERGFSPELGARPLKRAVEQHLLAPIAEAIVEQAVPEGDQFLLVSGPRDGRIEVRFVDPDSEEDDRGRDVDGPGPELDVRAVARGGGGDATAVEFLLGELRRTQTTVGELAGRKEAALQAMREAAFWEADDRHAVLGEVEYLDRLEAALETASKLGHRLEAAKRKNGRRGTGELAVLLALRLHVLSAALEGIAREEPSDAFLRLRVAADTDPARGAAWLETLAAMYSSWADRRGMGIRRLDEQEHVYAMTGLGAATLLRAEAGLHVLEEADGPSRRDVERVTALVQFAADDDTAHARNSALDRARTSLAAQGGTVAVVRRYRHEPSPLVRDSARGYRTGRIDRVLAGDFDLY